MVTDKTILVIVAHADDMEYFAGGTVAKLASWGNTVFEVITTNSEKGSVIIEDKALLKATRHEEAKIAAKILGVKEVFFLDYPDGELLSFPFNEIREKFIRLIRKIKPDILITFDPSAHYDSHQDHRVVGQVALEAGEFAHLPLFHPEHKEEGIFPHYVKEYLFFAKSLVNVNRVVDITNFIDLKISALLEHKTQMESLLSEIKIGLEEGGISPDEINFPSCTEQESYKNFVSLGIKTLASRAGEKIGVLYGEEFRYNSFGIAKEVFGDLFKDKESKF